MRKTLLFLFALCIPVPAAAQIPANYAYAFGGMVTVPRSAYTRWDGNFVYIGGGGEGRIAGRFALGGELGVLDPVTNRYALTTVLASVTPAYHFAKKETKDRFDPFVNGGLSVLGSQGVGFALHYGVGMNYWFHRRWGLRLEFRDHLWSPESGETVHLIAFRVGLAFH
jgi:Outer membrane protein beta-barrel domain